MFSLILFFLVGYFIIWPLIKFLRRVNRIQNQMNDMFSQARQQAAGQQRRQQEPPRTVRKKKIGNDVGEYVKFEEVTESHYSETTTSASGTYHTSVSSSQIEDVEWEDVK